jgi:hypothetical protein
MFVYNVTTKVELSIAANWLEWLKKEHIPDIIGTGCFTHVNILHLVEADDENGITYAVQYHAPSRSAYETYLEEYATTMRNRTTEKWGDRFVSFRTLMELVN